MLDIAEACSSFEVLAGQPRDRQGPWHGALARAFELGRTLNARLAAEIRAGRLNAPAFLRGTLGPEALDIRDDFQRDYPLELHSPFEGADSVAGAVWLGSDLFGDNRDDAIMKLRFDAGSYELPLHVHERSERVIVVLKGSGLYHFTTQTLESFDGTGVKTIPVTPGMVLVFTRGLLHTFSAPDEALYLLSYHGPFIPLYDPGQYTFPKMRWVPETVRRAEASDWCESMNMSVAIGQTAA